MFSPPPAGQRVAVVGGGISGLTAAYVLGQAGVEVSVLEAAAAVGGKLRLGEVAGVPVDEGAEAMLARRPEAVALAREVGLGDAVVHPATSHAGVWTRGRVRPLPPTLLGVPADLGALARARILSTRGLARASLERGLPVHPLSGDVAVGPLLAARLGGQVVDRLVEPLLGGVYAGRADELSLRATATPLATALDRGEPLLAAAARTAEGSSGDPVFAGITGGVGRLPAAVAAASGAGIRTGTTVRELHRRRSGWRLVTGPVPTPEAVEVDAVVLAVPAAPAARLLARPVPAAAAELSGIGYASVAIVTLAFRADAFPRPLRGSGFLVPAVDRRRIKACTFSSAKWGWLADSAQDVVVVRCSIGRYGESRNLQRDDAELVQVAVEDLAAAVGLRGTPLDAGVTRWGGALPQYAVGHVERVGRIRTAVGGAPGLAVCGAAYDGVGIAACVASGRQAATQVLSYLRVRARMQT